MPKNKETENKADNKEQKVTKKSTYSKKKKLKKTYQAVQRTFNQVLIIQLFLQPIHKGT